MQSSRLAGRPARSTSLHELRLGHVQPRSPAASPTRRNRRSSRSPASLLQLRRRRPVVDLVGVAPIDAGERGLARATFRCAAPSRRPASPCRRLSQQHEHLRNVRRRTSRASPSTSHRLSGSSRDRAARVRRRRPRRSSSWSPSQSCSTRSRRASRPSTPADRSPSDVRERLGGRDTRRSREIAAAAASVPPSRSPRCPCTRRSSRRSSARSALRVRDRVWRPPRGCPTGSAGCRRTACRRRSSSTWSAGMGLFFCQPPHE